MQFSTYLQNNCILFCYLTIIKKNAQKSKYMKKVQNNIKTQFATIVPLDYKLPFQIHLYVFFNTYFKTLSFRSSFDCATKFHSLYSEAVEYIFVLRYNVRSEYKRIFVLKTEPHRVSPMMRPIYRIISIKIIVSTDIPSHIRAVVCNDCNIVATCMVHS